MQTREIALLRPDQILAELGRCPVVYLPVGPLEWHGPHLPYGMDALHAEKIAALAAQETGGLILPTCYWGTERERSPEMLDWLGFPPDEWIVGMDFPANSLPSMYASEEVFAILMREQLRLAVNMGFKLIVLISGHGADNQIAVLKRLAAELNASGPARVIFALPFIANQAGVMEVGHASRVETALMMAIYPHTVDLNRLPPLSQPLRNDDWAIIDYQTFAGAPTPDRTVCDADDPRLATSEAGWRNLQLASAQIAAQVREALPCRAD